MDRDEAIQKFLIEVYGYGKIQEFIHEGKHEKGVTIRQFLDETIVGTFRGEAVSEKSPNVEIIVRWPRISTIKPVTDAQTRLTRTDLSYNIYNQSYFEGMSFDQTGTFLMERVMPLFPGVQLTHDKRTSWWVYKIDTSSFRLYLQGSYAHHSKQLSTDFYAPSELVNTLNTTVNQYYTIMRALK